MFVRLKSLERQQAWSQAPVDRELSGSSASARHGTFDIGKVWYGLVWFGMVWERLF